MTDENEDEGEGCRIELSCPFCSGFVMADASEGKVMHTLPPCSKFDELEPDDFLAAVRKKMSN